MKLLYQYSFDDGAPRLLVHRMIDGNYLLWTEDNEMVIPPAIADDLRIVLRTGFDPIRDDPREIAVDEEPPHLDD